MSQFEQVSSRHGAPMGRREDGDGNRKFTRAPSRFLAAVILDIPVPALKSGLPGGTTRYRHYADNPALLALHGVAMGQDPADYQWGAV